MEENTTNPNIDVLYQGVQLLWKIENGKMEGKWAPNLKMQ